jgi:hypothetical protein
VTLAGHAAAACAACAAPLAADQRFCLACGLRCAPDELRLAALASVAPAPALGGLVAVASAVGPPRPMLRSAVVTAVVVLTLGIAIGASLGPATIGETAAAQRAVIVLAAAPVPAAALTAPVALAPSGDGASADAGSATADSAGSAPTDPAPPAATDPTPAADAPAPKHPQPKPAATPPPGSVQLAGVVAAVGASGEEATIVDRHGALLAVHASGCGVQLGDDLHLRAHPLANGTWAADRVRRVRAGLSTATVVGVVSWVDPAGGRYALAARGTTLLVTVPPPPPPATAAPPSTPAVGDRIRVALTLTPAQGAQPASLAENARMALPPLPVDPPSAPPAPLELAGAIQTVDAQARTIVVALDAAGPPTATLTLTIPAGIVANRLLPAERVALTAAHAPDGTYALTGVSADGDASAADDPTNLQGDQVVKAPAPGDAQIVVSTCTLLTP